MLVYFYVPKYVPELFPNSLSFSSEYYVRAFLQFSPILLRILGFVFIIPQLITLFRGCAQLSCMLDLSGTYRVHAKRMKSAQGAEGVYRVMMGGASIGLTHLHDYME